ncbi:hypothetical protein PtB15_18B246 [Puccinia triticina]|nr:hypothetical protein PtB15_18B246 [Puccinia triticina]
MLKIAKESKIHSAVGDTQAWLIEAETKLLAFEQKAQDAEAKLAASESGSALCESLKKELKEKNLLVGKLQHEVHLELIKRKFNRRKATNDQALRPVVLSSPQSSPIFAAKIERCFFVQSDIPIISLTFP